MGRARQGAALLLLLLLAGGAAADAPRAYACGTNGNPGRFCPGAFSCCLYKTEYCLDAGEFYMCVAGGLSCAGTAGDIMTDSGCAPACGNGITDLVRAAWPSLPWPV